MKYWVYVNGEVPGSFEPQELAALPGFGDSSMVCPAEGGVQTRNWKRAGEFPDIAGMIQLRDKTARPAPEPLSAHDAVREAGLPATADEILNDAGSRIFRHVSALMKELESRREERALAQSLRREAAELKNELLALRERNKLLQGKADLVAGHESTIEDQDRRIKALGLELRDLKDGEARMREEFQRQTRLAEETSAQLAAKESTLAKAFDLIRRLESELAGIAPATGADNRRELPEVPVLAPADAPVDDASALREAADKPAGEMTPAAIMVAALTTPDDPKLPPEREVQPVPPPWQAALGRFAGSMRKMFK